MKKCLLLFSATLLLAISAVYAQPKIEVVGGMEYNWKDVTPKQSPLTADVTIKNIGNEKLRISDVKPSCGCTTAPLDKYELAPGESTLLHISFNLGSNSGKTSKTIGITSNDPANGKIYYTLKANIIRPIEVTPMSFFSFDLMRVGEEAKSTFFIKNNTENTITFTKTEVSPENLKTDMPSVLNLKPGEQIEVNVTLRHNKTGIVRPFINTTTNHPEYPEFKIEGYGTVKESPIFSPN